MELSIIRVWSCRTELAQDVSTLGRLISWGPLKTDILGTIFLDLGQGWQTF